MSSRHRNIDIYNEPNDRQPGTLVMTERWWRDRYDEIAGHGYKLRPRYHPRWQPSWLTSGKKFYSVEDGQPTILRAAMDATSTRDNRPVMLKKVLLTEGAHELSINRLFSSSELKGKPHNHCAPLLDVMELQNPEPQTLMVFPLLRPFDKPQMQTFGQFVDFFTQICEGLQFMHERNVAHRDCTANNIMLDPSEMYPDGFHPVEIDRSRDFKGAAKVYTRMQRPRKYYFIDFGLSRQYTSRNDMDEAMRGEDRSAPEHTSGRHCNPFHTDIYYIGNLVREEFINKYRGFDFMEDLISSMTHEDPARRPQIEQVLQDFAYIRQSLNKAKLRATIPSRKAPKAFRMKIAGIWQPLSSAIWRTVLVLCCASNSSDPASDVCHPSLCGRHR